MKQKKSIVFIENAYCCGHGEIVHRLENWLLANKIAYKKRKVTDRTTASYNGKAVELKPTTQLSTALAELGLQ